MTDAEKVKMLRQALAALLSVRDDQEYWRKAHDVMIATATEPAKPWWDDGRVLTTIGFSEAHTALYGEGYPLTLFYRAALEAAGVEVPE